MWTTFDTPHHYTLHINTCLSGRNGGTKTTQMLCHAMLAEYMSNTQCNKKLQSRVSGSVHLRSIDFDPHLLR